LRQALERTEEDLALVLGVLAGIWPSSLTPIDGGTHTRIVIDTPAGEISFSLRRDAAKRMWHVPEVADREPDEEAARLRDQRLMQLANGFAPVASPPVAPRRGAVSPQHLRVRDRRSGRSASED